ncbi:hypothetical protein C0995_005118 [Termitomyces sp. Mi166|nr:hypothetical protein C0995_005118 [Termitomyces sp. Mi166\
MNEHLATAYCITNNANNTLTKLDDIDDWIATVLSIDDNLHAQQWQFEDMLKVAKAEAATANAGKKSSFKVTTATNTSIPLTSGLTMNASTSVDANQTRTCKYIYLLTEIECLLFFNHEGCMKCRKFYMGANHNRENCPQNEPPLLTTYILLTKDLAKTTRKHYIAAGGKLKNTGKSTLIAMVMINSVSNSSDGDGSDTAHADQLAELEEDYAYVKEYVFPTHIM